MSIDKNTTSEKIMLVTGANSGMGKATVAALSDAGATVVMLCRDKKRAEAAYQEIMCKPGRKIDLMLCDLSDLDSIRRFSDEFKNKYDHLDVLVNNAGVITLDRRETKDGLELQFGMNHIGHFLLTLLLLDLIEKAQNGRIVVVSSGAHKVGKIYFEDYNLKKGYNVIRSYSQAKLANLLFVRELSKRLKEQNSRVTINAAHPGAVATEMGIDRKTGFGRGITKLLKPFFLTPEQGAKTAVFLALDPSVSHISGEYFYKCKIASSSARSKDSEAAKKLFDLSENICKISQN